MSFSNLVVPAMILLGLVVVIFGMVGLFKAFYRKVDQGTALIINDMSAVPKVRFTGALIIPVLYRAEEMKISLIHLQIERKGSAGLICRDNMRADIDVAFYLRVNETPQDVLRVAKAVGAARASNKDAVNELFNAKFSEALKTAGKKFDFIDLFEKRQEFREEIIEVIGNDLNGYVLEDVAIDYLEQTARKDLDENNILDAEGIRKITELTAKQNIITNQLRQDEHLAVTKKNVETREATLSLERQQAEAEARQKREIASVQAREQAEADKVIEEQRLIAQNAHIETQEKIDIREQNRHREVEVAEQNRMRAVRIETERVNRATELERVTTDREVQMQTVERDKVVETGRMEVANVVRERTAIEQTVAIAEEKIKETRQVSAADRDKQVAVLEAEAAAEEDRIRAVKAAEGAAQSADFRAKEITTLAEADLSAAGKQAEAKRVLADGIRAEEAASGLAKAAVQEAMAQANEKTGIAEARVQEAMADANYKKGNADVRVMAERLDAEATGTEKLGAAEASAIGNKLKAEAAGLVDKFDALGKMTKEAREHEEFRLQLETALSQALAAIEAGKSVSKENASVMAKAMESANIELIGGEGNAFESMLKGISLGKAVEGFASSSPALTELLSRVAGSLPSVQKKVESGNQDA